MNDIGLYLKNGDKASLKDVCIWWLKTYPFDVFVNEPKLIIDARNSIHRLLKMINYIEQNTLRESKENEF